MRNGLARHVKTNIKNTKKQKIEDLIMAGECCYFCKHRGILYGHFSDAVDCSIQNRTVPHVYVCDKFERRE